MSRTWYAEKVCELISHGRLRHYQDHWGWGDYLARWIWLTNKNLEVDPPGHSEVGMSGPQPYPMRDPWEGTDEEYDDEPIMGPGDYCHHGVPFDEDCYWCDDEIWEDEA